MTDLGIQAGVNEDSISNQSGDTLLLEDDTHAVIVNSYAEILRNRESATPVEVTPGSQTDGTYHGRGRRITDLERNHFHEDNITPGRPCTAYFTASYFVDSQAVFDKLTELDIPRESVVCLQRRPSRDMLITFVDMETKIKFVNNVIRLLNSSGVINDDDSPLTFLNIYDAPRELSNEALEVWLEKYCTVIASRRGKLPKSSVYNGIRHFRVRLKEPLPSYLRFGKFLVRMSHDGQQHTCRRCNRAGHFANECQNTVCFNCDELGHQSRECGMPVRCCKSEAHMTRRCPYSWYQRANPPAPEPNPTGPDPNVDNNVPGEASGDPADPSSSGDVAAPAGDLSHPSDRADFSVIFCLLIF